MSDPMTLDDKTKALLKAAKDQSEINRGARRTGPVTDALNAALAAFEPEPEMVYTMPEWSEIPELLGKDRSKVDWFYPVIDGRKSTYNALRELTRQPKVEGREWWLYELHDGTTRAYDHRPINLTGTKAIHVREVPKP